MKYPRLWFFLVLLTAVFSAPLSQAVEKKSKASYFRYAPEVRLYVYQVEPKEGPIQANVLFLHGYGDCSENHPELFDAWVEKGYRVISFDYPGHGKSQGMYNYLNYFNFHDLAKMAVGAVNFVEKDEERPLILAGWSTGGLLALRLAQLDSMKHFKTTPSALVLLDPAISPKLIVGNRIGRITRETLTSNPEGLKACPVNPQFPLLHARFSSSLLWNSTVPKNLVNDVSNFFGWDFKWQDQQLSPDFPTLIVMADPKYDRYVNFEPAKDWAFKQVLRNFADITMYQCHDAFHAVDVEPRGIGTVVRRMAADFPTSVLNREWDHEKVNWKINDDKSVCDLVLKGSR
ncbi:lysophospholipase [bacterium]|nr:lysophospholipase [bacterium]